MDNPHSCSHYNLLPNSRKEFILFSAVPWSTILTSKSLFLCCINLQWQTTFMAYCSHVRLDKLLCCPHEMFIRNDGCRSAGETWCTCWTVMHVVQPALTLAVISLSSVNNLLSKHELDPIRRYLPASKRPKRNTRYSAFEVSSSGIHLVAAMNVPSWSSWIFNELAFGHSSVRYMLLFDFSVAFLACSPIAAPFSCYKLSAYPACETP